MLPARFKYVENNVFVTQLKQATRTSIDHKGHNSQKDYDYFLSDSENEQFPGSQIYVSHAHREYSDKKEDWIDAVC